MDRRILYLATTNTNKIKEISHFIQTVFKDTLFFKQPSVLLIKSLRDIPNYSIPEEKGSSFQENANIKSKALWKRLRDQSENVFGVLAEDSGLEVFSLKGAPGIFSARYSASKATDKENNQLLLKRMEKRQNRQARYVCALSFLYLKAEKEFLKNWTAYCEGSLGFKETGQRGFGYDPLFIPKGESKSFGELPFEFKQKTSHRALALKKWRNYLLSLRGL